MDFKIDNGVLVKYTGKDKDVVIPDGVTSIGSSAFENCSRLQSITIPDSVTSIGDGAFGRCVKLQSVTIPDSVTSIGVAAFWGCKNLQSVTIPDGVTSIGDGAFGYCSSLQSITIPDRVTNIGKKVFYSCENLQSVTIPDGVTSIGDGAFMLCSSLTSVTLPDGVTSIGDKAFGYCSSLQSITIPDSVTNIGDCTFAGCKGLADAEGFAVLKGILYRYYGSSNEVVIPDVVTSIGDAAFWRCSSLQSVTIPDGVTSIGERAFEDCSGLESITIPSSVTSIGSSAFENCHSLQSIAIPDGVTSIGDKMFYKCSNLQSITIPDSVTSIGESAFGNCSSLQSVTIPSSVTSIGNETFWGCSSLQSVTIPDSVASIGVAAFWGCKNLQSVTIPDGVTSIGNETFWGCSSLQSVTIPDSVTSIGDDAFTYCSSLQSIIIPSSVTSIGKRVFGYCSSLQSITIPDGVTSIGDDAFAYCSSLQSVTMPDSVTSVGAYAFYGCQKLAHFDIKNEKFKFGKEPFGNALPGGLLVSIEQLYMHLADGSLKKYILTEDVWNILNISVRTEIFMSCQGKALLPLYAKHEKSPNDLGKAILTGLTAKATVKECSAAANFLILFVQKADDAVLRSIYEAIKPLKTAEKACKAIEADAVLMEKLGSGETAQNFTEIEKAVVKHLATKKMTITELMATLKDFYGLTSSDLPELLCKDGSAAGTLVFTYLLSAHEILGPREYGWAEVTAEYQQPGPCREAAEIVALLDEASLQKALAALAENYLGRPERSHKMFLAFPICRYADEALMSELTRRAPKWASKFAGEFAPPLLSFRNAALYSETQAAMYFAEKYHELDRYASIRGTTEDDLRDQYLSDIGLDAQGGKRYDLGNQTVTVRLQKDLSFLVELPDGKTAKSLPKKGADEEKYASANAAFAQMKKDAKKIVKNRCNVLFEDFLSARARSAEDWQRSYLQNPLLRSVAKLIVWSQGKCTFTLTNDGAICSDETPYAIGTGKICVAHPMEMTLGDAAAWQAYFRSHDIKQPFEQIWEPAYTADEIHEDRYEGMELFYRYVQNTEKHGIHYYDEDFHAEVGFTLDDCDLENELNTPYRHEIAPDATFTLGRFTFKKFTRKVNHIVYLFDKWTIRERIRRDDSSVMAIMGHYNAAQITDFLNTAIESKAANLTAALLDYKQEHFPEYDAFSEFTLE